MKLKLNLQTEPKHSDLVSCLGWANANELYSVSDDHQILKWDFRSGKTSQVVTLPEDTFVTDIHWFPTSATSHKQSARPELFVLSCTDGKFMLVSHVGRVEKTVEGHKGAVLGARWSRDGTALLTYGEDGAAKIWSRSGMLRTSLAQTGGPIYCSCWSPDSDHVLYAKTKTLVIKSLKPGLKPFQWNAHEGLILCVDWSPAHDFIISGGEDRKYKVWDNYGRNLYSSSIHDSPISSLSWSPDGEMFAVGAFNTLRLCDKKGWSYSLEKPSTGSILKLAWTSDGTQFAGSCANGQVVFAQVVDRHLEWNNLVATVNGDNSIDIKDVMNDSREHLDFNDSIIKVSLGWGHLVATTASQGFIYNARNWTTPVIMDLRSGAVSLIIQTNKHFLMTDDSSGITVMSYEGRVVSTIKVTGLQPGSLNSTTISLSPDVIALRDKKEEKCVRIFDALTGKEINEGQPLRHNSDIITIALSQSGPTHQRLLAFMDKNNDLYLTSVQGQNKFKLISLGPMVTTICWNDTVNMLAAMQDGKFVVWYYPSVIYSDKDLLPQIRITKDGSEFSKSPQLLQFTGRHCNLRRSDGALISTSLSPFPTLLHQLTASEKWEAAVRLCRFVQEPAIWACLAGMAACARELNTAEVAYAAINEIDKVQFISYLRELPADKRNAELALFCGEPQEAEKTYLKAGMIFMAIKLNMSLFNWERALELAVKHKTHVDTVLGYRERFLNKIGSKEGLKQFLQFGGKMTINWEKIEAKVALEEGRAPNPPQERKEPQPPLPSTTAAPPPAPKS